MYYKWLQAFHFVAIYGGFTRAAHVIRIGQPTLSIHVANLEKFFEVELFYRKNRKVVLTPIGNSLLNITKGLFGYETEALKLLNSTKELNVGELRIHATVAYDVMEILQAFRENHPKILSNITIGTEDEVLESLKHFSSDIGIVGRRIDDKKYFSQLFARHEVKAIFNTSHPLAENKNLSLRELDGYEMILRSKNSTTRTAFEAAIKEKGVEVSNVMEMNSREAIREAVIRGFGFAVMSSPAFHPHENLRAISFADADIFTEVFIISLAERNKRLLLREFFLKAESLSSIK